MTDSVRANEQRLLVQLFPLHDVILTARANVLTDLGSAWRRLCR